jgi:hypothetical protein
MTLPFRIVETTPALPLADLLASLQLRQPEAWARWAAGGGPALFGPERLPLSCGGQVVGQVIASASLDGTRGAVRLAREAQIVELRTIPSPSGLRWLWKCPVSELLCLRLYLPQGAVGFAGRQAHALRYRSEIEKPGQRAMRRAAKLRRGQPGTAPHHVRRCSYLRLERRYHPLLTWRSASVPHAAFFLTNLVAGCGNCR